MKSTSKSKRLKGNGELENSQEQQRSFSLMTTTFCHNCLFEKIIEMRTKSSLTCDCRPLCSIFYFYSHLNQSSFQLRYAGWHRSVLYNTSTIQINTFEPSNSNRIADRRPIWMKLLLEMSTSDKYEIESKKPRQQKGIHKERKTTILRQI